MRLLALPGRRLAVATAALPLLAGGCYSSRPLDLSALPPGQVVTLTLTPVGTDALTGVIGPQVERLEAELVRASSDSLDLRLLRTTRQDGREDPWQRQRVQVARGQVSAVAERRLDKKRSWLAAAALLAVVVALGAAVSTAGTDGSEPQPIPSPGN
jgi:hypothetical protein